MENQEELPEEYQKRFRDGETDITRILSPYEFEGDFDGFWGYAVDGKKCLVGFKTKAGAVRALRRAVEAKYELDRQNRGAPKL